MVDLTRNGPDILARYMGKEQARSSWPGIGPDTPAWHNPPVRATSVAIVNCG